jgi:hypothetical protein
MLGTAGDPQTHKATSANRIAQLLQIVLHRATIPNATRVICELSTGVKALKRCTAVFRALEPAR